MTMDHHGVTTNPSSYHYDEFNNDSTATQFESLMKSINKLINELPDEWYNGIINIQSCQRYLDQFTYDYNTNKTTKHQCIKLYCTLINNEINRINLFISNEQTAVKQQINKVDPIWNNSYLSDGTLSTSSSQHSTDQQKVDALQHELNKRVHDDNNNSNSYTKHKLNNFTLPMHRNSMYYHIS